MVAVLALGGARTPLTITDSEGREHRGYICRVNDLPMARALRIRAVTAKGEDMDEADYLEIVFACILGIGRSILEDCITQEDMQQLVIYVAGDAQPDPTAADKQTSPSPDSADGG